MHDTAIEAAALLVLERGLTAVSIDAVHSVTGIGRDRLIRAYRTTAGLAAAVYIEGHTRARALCAARLHPNTTAVVAVAACAHALLAQAAADPVVRALHALEMTTTASTTGLPSIYSVWTTSMIETLTQHPNATAAQRAQAGDIVSVLVAALAGLCTPHARHHHMPPEDAARARSQALAVLCAALYRVIVDDSAPPRLDTISMRGSARGTADA